MIIGLEDNHNVIWDPVFRRLRCNGHIINLSAQSFLFPNIKDVDEEEALNQITGQLPKEFNNAQMQEWRQKGPLGKIHNISVFITLSTQRIETFKSISGGLSLSRDNATRWNSWFQMLLRALDLKEPIDNYVYKERKHLAEDQLSEQEWTDLEKLIEFLEAYQHATLACEGRYATVDKILPIMEFLLDVLEKGKDNNVEDPFIGPCCMAGWEKLIKYYRKTEESIAYIASIVLCPQYKWDFFIKVGWEADWITKAQTQVRDLWDTEYKGKKLIIKEFY